MKNTIQKIHHAVQFIAFFSNSFLEHKGDDSHTNFKWNPIEDRFMSQAVPVEGSPYISISCVDLNLFFHSNDHELFTIDLQSLSTRDELLKETSKGLKIIGLDPNKFKEELHYELPNYINLNKVDFKIYEDKTRHFAYLHTKAYEVIGIFQKQYSGASKLRIWPHHFDHSISISLQNQSGAAEKSISLGLGIPDNYVDQPYFYVTHWTKEGNVDRSKIDRLPHGTWQTDKWLAAVLTHDELHANDQKERVEILYSFFEAAFEQSKKLILSN